MKNRMFSKGRRFILLLTCLLLMVSIPLELLAYTYKVENHTNETLDVLFYSWGSIAKAANVYAKNTVTHSYSRVSTGRSVIIEPLSGATKTCPSGYKVRHNGVGTLECVAKDLPKSNHTYVFD